MAEKLTLELKAEISNGSYEYIILEEALIEDVVSSSFVRYNFHDIISTCFDAWGNALDEYMFVDENDNVIYPLEVELQNLISSKDFNDVDISGECAKGTIYLRTR